MSTSSQLERRYLALVLTLVLAFLILYLFYPFLTGIAGAVIFYVLLKPLYRRLVPVIKSRSWTAFLLIVISFLVIVMPLAYAVYSASMEFITVLNGPGITNFLSALPINLGKFNLNQFILDNLTTVSDLVQNVSLTALGKTMDILLNLLVMYLILFYLLLNEEKVFQYVVKIIPFNQERSKQLLLDQEQIIKSTLISNGLVSIILGILFAGGLYFAHYNNLFFWFFLSAVFAFIPITGIPFIWIPMGIYYYVKKDYMMATGIVVWGSFLSFVLDLYIRQKVQKWVGQIHPFISLMGFIMGTIYFGMVGIVVGPLLLSLAFSFYKLYGEEYSSES